MNKQASYTDTIVAIATASGVASIGIVRVSGSHALKLAKKVAKNLHSFTPRKAHLTSLYNKDQVCIDSAIVLYFKSPQSFTGEDVVEFQCHGGLVVVQEVLDTLSHYGARLATPGEFSKRAFLNGKIDLSEAEAIAGLIEAKSVQAAKILAKQMKGEVRLFVEESKEVLLKIMAHTEVMIDYAEEDLPSSLLEALSTQLNTLIVTVKKLVEASHARRGLIEGFKVAIIGKPNVGKSSLLNALLAYDRAIVSDIAGTTRDTIEEQIRIGSHIIRLVDTAGIRESTNSIEQIGIERSLESIKEADVIVALFDSSSAFSSEDQVILEHLQVIKQQHIVVALNKIDLPMQFDKTKLKDFPLIEVSAKNDFTRLTKALEDLFNSLGDEEEFMLVSGYQIDAVEKTIESLECAKERLHSGELELFAYHTKEAIEALSSISTPFNSEDVLDTMFSEFCLGK